MVNEPSSRLRNVVYSSVLLLLGGWLLVIGKKTLTAMRIVREEFV